MLKRSLRRVKRAISRAAMAVGKVIVPVKVRQSLTRPLTRIIYGISYTVGALRTDSSADKISPVFIVGTGRCGTTLLIRILKTHPQISVFPGEANSLWHPKLDPPESAEIDIAPIEVNPRAFTETSLQNWPLNHEERIKRIMVGYLRITGKHKKLVVKSAMISFMVPKLVEMFPEAKFIHIFRTGPSVVESYFKKNFGKYPRFACSEDEYYKHCSRYWQDCILEIEKARALFKENEDKFYELSYENLCDSPSEIVQEIANFVGVDHNDFDFDLSAIESTNYKVGDFASEERWKELLPEMKRAMELKGYL